MGLISGLLFAGREQGFVRRFISIAEHDKPNLPDLWVFLHEGGDGVKSNSACPVDGKSVYTGAYRRKGNGSDAVFHRKTERVLVGAAQQGILVVRPAPPDGSYGVDDKSGSQMAAAGNDGLSGRAFSLGCPDALALFENPRSTGVMNGSVDASAAQEAGVCRIDNGIGILDRDIAANQCEHRRSDMDMLTHDGINLRNGG
jgi:hypothetical protein